MLSEGAIELAPLMRLNRDLRDSARELTAEQARYLVDYYYTVQEYRISAANQVRASSEHEEPNALLNWMYDQTRLLENDVRAALNTYSDEHVPGVWAKSITGIGPVIAAGLLAHVNIENCSTVGKLWSFAGLNPEMTWEKGQKRPFNARLKVLCWKIGESFVKVQNRESDIYGKVFAERKQQEVERNEAGLFSDQAAAILERKKIGKDTDAYKAYSKGKLPPAHLHARAKRYAVKLFLSHFHHVAYVDHFGEDPPKPYIIEHGGHTNFIGPPNWPID